MAKMKIFLGAVVDGEFLTDVAEALFQKKEVLKVPVMMGITNHEFGWILPQVAQSSHGKPECPRHEPSSNVVD